MALVQSRYADFGPTLAAEKLGEQHGLLVYVDDATSRLMELRFVRSESTFDYLEATRSYLERHGKPVAFCSDQASVIRVADSPLREISDVDSANAFAPAFIADYNRRFARSPRSEHELHATAFPKDRGVRQGDVVDSKRLSSTMDLIREKQRRRAEETIAKPFTPLRDARLLRAGVPRRTTPSTSPKAPL